MSQKSVSKTQSHTNHSETLVEVENLKTYYDTGGLTASNPVKAVDDVSFDIQRGETVGLVGESGCGKTTLGRTLTRLEESTDGSIYYDGTDITTLSGSELLQWRRDVQIVFQDPDSSLNNRMTIGEIVREPLDVHDWPNITVAVESDTPATISGDGSRINENSDREAGITVTIDSGEPTVRIRQQLPLDPKNVSVSVDDRGNALEVSISINKSEKQLRRSRVRELLETVGLSEEHYYRYPHQFSGGQRQRIGIARALALEPDFIVLDEPVSALDASVQAKILNLLEDLQEKFRLTYLFIAHDLSVVRHICDRVAVMYLGNIMEIGETDELFDNPANPYTHSLLSAIPEPDPTAERERITLRGTPPSPRHPPTGCPFSTRCPMKIHPEEHRELNEEIWMSIEAFRETLRQRHYTERTLLERAREVLGMETRFADADELADELFGDHDLPPQTQTAIDKAIDHIESGREQRAREHLADEFGSVCDDESPEAHTVSEDGRTSRCHRHRESYREPDTYYEEVHAPSTE